MAKGINILFYSLNHFISKISYLISSIAPLYPFVLHIRITSKCNLSCPFCYLKDGLNQDETDHLTLEEWHIILKDLPRYTIIDITGSEPFMTKGFVDFLSLVKSLGFRCSITTNGTIYNNDLIEKLILMEIDYILVSMDGHKDLHNKLRGNSNAFDRTSEFLSLIETRKKELKKKRPLINVKTMVLDENINELESLIYHIDEKINPNIITLNLPFQNNARGGLVLSEDFKSKKFSSGNTFKFYQKTQTKSFLDNLNIIKKKISKPLIIKPMIKDSKYKSYIDRPELFVGKSCKLYTNNVTLYYDGSLTPCDISLKITNIRELNYKIKDLFKHKNYLKFKKEKTLNTKVCEGCVFSIQSPVV